VVPADAEHGALQGLRVLLVEDDPNLNELVGQMLAEQGTQVLAATTAAEGFTVLRKPFTMAAMAATLEAALGGR
jgi:DNA-binding response OmpR family regulator